MGVSRFLFTRHGVHVMFLNMFVTVLALTVIFGIWVGVHLLARGQMGDRKLGCRGPVKDDAGNAWCCKDDGTLCEHADEAGDHLPEAH